jgi:hypothetical protein
VKSLRAGLHTVEALPRGQGPGKKKMVAISRDKVSSVEFVFE